MSSFEQRQPACSIRPKLLPLQYSSWLRLYHRIDSRSTTECFACCSVAFCFLRNILLWSRTLLLAKLSGGKPPFSTCNFAHPDLLDLTLSADPLVDGFCLTAFAGSNILCLSDSLSCLPTR